MTHLDECITPNGRQAYLGDVEDIFIGVCRAPLCLGEHTVLRKDKTKGSKKQNKKHTTLSFLWFTKVLRSNKETLNSNR